MNENYEVIMSQLAEMSKAELLEIKQGIEDMLSDCEDDTNE